MIDPRRLSDSTEDPFERDLLRSARHDRASAAVEARCIAGIAAAALVATNTAAATAASATVLSATATATGTGILIKAVAIGLTLGLAAQGSVVASRHVLAKKPAQMQDSAAHPRMASSARQVTELATPVASTPAPRDKPEILQPKGDAAVGNGSAALLAPAPKASPAVTESAGPSRRLSGSQLSASAVPTTLTTRTDRTVPNDVLEREVAILDEARHAYSVGAYARALSLLERHYAEFPAGELGPEALVIRVQALLGLGRRSDAEVLAKQHIAFHPQSAVARRLSMLLGWKSG